jgi:hypothetical protein
MVQIINDPRSNPYQALASSAGRGLSAGLQNILNQKIEAMQRKPIRQELEALNISPEDAAFISRLPPKEQLAALQAYQYQSQQPQEQNGIQAMQGGYQPQQQQYQPHAPQQQQQPFRSGIVGGGSPAQSLARQRSVNSANAPFLKKFGTALDNAESAKSSLLRMKDLVQNGKVASGIKGQVLPQFLQNSDTQLFDKESNTLAGILSGQQGVPTGYKIKFALTQKPNINQNRQTQIRLIDNLLEEVEKVIVKGDIRDTLISQNNGEQPSNLETLINQQYKQYRNLPQDIQQEFENRPRNPRQQENFEQLAEQEGQAPENPQYNADNESTLGSLVRGGVRTASRVGEALAGTPGDIAATGLGIANYLSGGAVPSYGQVQGKLPVSFPTSEQIKGAVGRATSGYTNPQGGTEETIDSAVQTFASLFLPSKLKIPLINNLTKVLSPEKARLGANIIMPFSGTTWSKALGMTAAGEAAQSFAASAGAGPLGQAGAKIAAMALAGTAGGKSALESKKTQSYDQARAALGTKYSPKNTVPSKSILEPLAKIENKLGRAPVADKGLIKEILDEVKSGIGKSLEETAGKPGSGTRIPLEDLINQKIALNGWLERGYFPRVSGETYLPKTVRPWINDINDVFRKELASYGKSHPKFGIPFALAEDIHAGLADINSINNFALNLGTTFSNNFTSTLLKGMLKTGLKYGIGPAFGPYVGFWKNKEVQKHYLEMLKSASQNSLPEFKRAAASLDKEAIKYEKNY